MFGQSISVAIVTSTSTEKKNLIVQFPHPEDGVRAHLWLLLEATEISEQWNSSRCQGIRKERKLEELRREKSAGRITEKLTEHIHF